MKTPTQTFCGLCGGQHVFIKLIPVSSLNGREDPKEVEYCDDCKASVDNS